MMDNYKVMFEEVSSSLEERFADILLDFKIVGYTALDLAGLRQRETADLDILGIGLLADSEREEVKFLNKEFGKGSLGERRYGFWLDIVSKSIIWLPPYPEFIDEYEFKCLKVSRLTPVDVCVSKVFSNFQKRSDRKQDKGDILYALSSGIVSFEDFVKRIDETFPKYETHSSAPEVFSRVINFIKELQSDYGPTSLNYKIPNWMENM